MPYTIHKGGSCPDSKPWGVVKKSDGSLVPGGCHATKEDAQKHLGALESNVKESSQAATLSNVPLTRTDHIAAWAYGDRPYWLLEKNTDERKKLAKEGKAMPDGSYPIDSSADLDKAISAVGRGGADHDAIRKHIINQAKKRGESDKIPDNWNPDGSLKDAGKASMADTPSPHPAGGGAEPSDTPNDHADTEVAKLIDEAIAAQEKDEDQDPEDERVLTLLKQAKVAQAKDTDDEVKPEEKEGAEKPSSEKPGEELTALARDPNSVCSNGNCGHPFAEHESNDVGEHAGGCLVANCMCSQYASNEEPQDNEGEGQEGKGEDAEGAEGQRDVDMADAPVEPVAAEKTKPPEAEGGEIMGPAFTIPVAIVEGEPTGDGRAIACGALDWRVPPLPLMGMATSAHDPTGMSPNAPAIICGRIDSLSRTAGEQPDTEVISAKGYFLANEDGEYWAKLAEEMGRIGVSADVAVDESEQEIGELDEHGFPMSMTETLTKGTIMAVTACPTPAFEGAYLVLGDGAAAPAPIPQENETASGAMAPHFLSYTACEPCINELDVLEASGGPLAPPKAWFANPEFTEGDGRLVEILDKRSQRTIGGKWACPLTITDDGRIYGHLAPWGVCHSGFPNACVTAPHSKVDYAHFKRAQSVVTAEGEEIRVGVLTMDAGHAPTRRISVGQAMAHYDNTAWAIADINCGEDEYGIWIAGALRPDATEEQVRRLRAASVSGDWRNMGSGLELVAALAVNQPGYPLAQVASGHAEAMVATGAGVMHRLKHPAEEEVGPAPDPLTQALMPLLRQQRERVTSQFARTKALRRLARVR